MKCNCDKCSGSGEIPCPKCNGSGSLLVTIQSADLSIYDDILLLDHEELAALQKDARRCIDQANTLKAMNPSRAYAYEVQLQACLRTINAQVDKLFEKVNDFTNGFSK